MPAADPFAVHADGNALAGKQACEGRPGELRALISVEISQRSPPAVVSIDLVATEVAYERVDWIPTDGTKITDAL